jgi:hypothetical protein
MLLLALTPPNGGYSRKKKVFVTPRCYIYVSITTQEVLLLKDYGVKDVFYGMGERRGDGMTAFTQR